MEYKIENIEGGIRIVGLKNFNLTHIFECGQAFRWEKTEEESYIVVAFGRVVEFFMEGEDLLAYNTSEDDFRKIWHPYFDLDKDYDQIKNDLRKTKAFGLNDSLKEAMDFGYGIRILNQDRFETIISFIISANNQIPRIKKSVDLLAQQYGDFIENYKGKDYYSFPSPGQLKDADPLEVKEVTRVGFRNERIVNTSKAIYNKDFDLDGFESLSDEKLRSELIKLEGVGPKVAACILLFAYDRGETFPIDVWVKRLMETLYIGREIKNKEIDSYADEIFGVNKGYAQQYLFYYARENAIGK